MTCSKCKGKLELLFVSWQCPGCDLGETKPEFRQDTAQSRSIFWVSLMGQGGCMVPNSLQRFRAHEILGLPAFVWNTSRFRGVTIHGVVLDSDRGYYYEYPIQPIVVSGNDLLVRAEPLYPYVRAWMVVP